MVSLVTAPHAQQSLRWPKTGRHILAQYDASSVVVYQAYRPSIAQYAVEHNAFGGSEFSFARMSWIKPSFLWMMFRCGWATKPDQEAVLAIKVHREFFDRVLQLAVATTSTPPEPETSPWRERETQPPVRMQWDPDHSPSGEPLERRTIQLGLRGSALAGFRGEAIASIEDITEFVIEQRERARLGTGLITPAETPYPISDLEIRQRLRLSE